MHRDRRSRLEEWAELVGEEVPDRVLEAAERGRGPVRGRPDRG